MQVIDSFRFPTHIVSEKLLFNWQPEDFLAQSPAELMPSEIPADGVVQFDNIHNCYVLFDSSAEALERVGNSSTNGTANSRSWLSLLTLNLESGHKQLHDIQRLGFKGVVLHPYLQRITENKYSVVVELCRQASKQGLIVVVCTAYGGATIYDIYPLQIAQKIASVIKSPLILSHAGGVKVLEAMLLADIYPHIWLDTSFSLSYWLGSSVEQDFAFAMRKMGSQRWLYGSDAPFLPPQKALSDHLAFFQKHAFSDIDIENMMSGNSRELFAI